MVRSEPTVFERMSKGFALSCGAALLCVAVVYVAFSDNNNDNNVLLAKAAAAATPVHEAAAAAHAAAAAAAIHPKVVAAAAAAAHAATARPTADIGRLPKALRAAEKQQEMADKQRKERVLAAAAKNALKEYSTLRSRAALSLEHEDAHVRTLVSSAARELIAEEAIAKQRAAQRHRHAWADERQSSTSTKQRSEKGYGKRWSRRMREAERAALDVIQRSDKATSKSTLAWKQYALQQAAKIKAEKQAEAMAEKQQSKHILDLVKQGKISASTPLHEKKDLVRKHAKLTKAQRIARARKLAMIVAKKALADENKGVKAQVRQIASKELPLLQKHISRQVKAMASRKHWHKIEKFDKVTEAHREQAWLNLIKTVRASEKQHAKIQAAKVALEKKQRALIKRALRHTDESHLTHEVNAIVGKASPSSSATARNTNHNLAATASMHQAQQQQHHQLTVKEKPAKTAHTKKAAAATHHH